MEYAHHEEENVELPIANVIAQGSHLTILNMYASPNATLDNIIATLTKAMCNIQLNQRILILGNFNIDLSKMNTKTKALENYMHGHNFHILLDKEKVLSKLLIDNVWSNCPIQNFNTFILDAYWTNHDAIYVVLNNANKNTP